MARAALFLSIFLLSVGLISYAAEAKKEVRKIFCRFHSAECKEVGKMAKSGMKSVCWFHKDHAERLEITSMRYPNSAWYDTSKETEMVDRIDGHIAGSQNIPYTYRQIKKQPNINAYVLKTQYELARDDALMYLCEREKFFSKQLQDNEDLQLLQREDLKFTLERIQEYVTILNSDMAPKLVDVHECVGLIVSIRAVMVALQWAHFADDHTDKSKEELKKTLPEDDELVALCSELDKLVEKPKNNKEDFSAHDSW